MSAKELGARLLAEVEETNLHELLEQLRATTSSSTSSLPSHFNSPPLDYITNFFLTSPPPPPPPPHDASSTSPTSPRQPSRPQYPPSVELTSLKPCAGKTQLIYHLLARCVVSTPTHKAAAAIVLDTDGRFSISRLADIIRVHIVATRTTSSDPASGSTSDPATAAAAVSHALHTALTHIHIFRPQSHASLVSTLQSLPDYLLSDPPQHYSTNLAIGLLVLDSASAFFWPERMAAELAQLDADDDSATSPTTGTAAAAPGSSSPHAPASPARGSKAADLATALRSVQHQFSCPLIYTTQTISSSTSTLPPPLSALPPTFPTLRLLISRDPVPRFPASLDISALRLDAGPRLAVVEKGAGTARVVPGGGLDRSVRERMGALAAGEGRRARGWAFWVGGEGVGVGEE